MTATRIPRWAIPGFALTLMISAAWAAPVTYEVDSAHTYPTFEADHMGGVSKWRGKINSTSGTVVLDAAAQTGSVDLTMDMTTIDFGHQGLNDHAQTADLFDTAQYPTARFRGELTGFRNGAPTSVDGELTMHGQTHPVTLAIGSFVCKQHPMMAGREVCGADATAQIDRSQWGIDFGAPLFHMDVMLRISVEALAAE
ncbi:MAG: YceI family protein [Gammaproteobacteria bacterium]